MANITTDFIKATNKIAATVRGITSLLHSVQEDLRLVREKVVAGDEKKTIDCLPRKDVYAEHNPVNAERKAATTEVPNVRKQFLNDVRKYFTEFRSYVELSTLLLLFLYTCETKRTNNLTSDALTASKQQFALEHRPYLWQVSAMVPGVDAIKGNVQISFGGKEGTPRVTVATQVQNFAQSPAVVTRFAGDVVMGGKDGYLMNLKAHRWINFSGVMPPGRIDNFRAYSEEIVQANARIEDLNPVIGALLRIQYTDTEGHLFESDMCIYTPNGAIGTSAYCPASLNLTRLIDCQEETCER
jgi:hypothetical protein